MLENHRAAMYLAQPQRPHPMPQPPPPLSMDRITTSAAAYQAPLSAHSAGAMTPVSTRSQGPEPTETTYGGWNWKLDVVQQPVRARMCGFGDKDRRPITPPPCVRLIVTDAKTGKEIDVSEIDMTFFVLTCDLWDEKGTTEVNLVKHSSTSPSISTATATSYPPPASQQGPMPDPNWNPMLDTRAHPDAQRSQAEYYAQTYSRYDRMTQEQRGYHPHQPQHSQPYPQNPQYPHQNRIGSTQSYSNPSTYAYSPQHPPQSQYGYTYQSPVAQTPTNPYGQQGHGHPLPSPTSMHPSMPPPGMSPTMFTRNLIGSLSASAFRLTDPDNKVGVWFILQDLSVRTEGQFRLKMSFVNVGTNLPSIMGTNGHSSSHPATPTASTPTSGFHNPSTSSAAQPVLNQGSAPVLASVYSEPFQVFSAKKFPGVIESTPLSKCFALQGIKIPIRKDAKGSGRGSASIAGDGEGDGDDDGFD